MKVSEAASVRLVDYGPKDGDLGIDQVVAATGLLVFKKGTIQKKKTGLTDKKVKVVHRESTRRGHASITTTPSFWFEVGGSRVLDFYFSTFPHGSYLIFSSRRITIEKDDFILPDALPNKARSHMLLPLKVYQRLWDKSKDQGRKVMPLGFCSHGFFKYSAEEIIYINREKDRLGVPHEVGLIAEKMDEQLREKAPILHEAAQERPSLFYHHPNVFHVDKWHKPEGIKVSASPRLESVLQGEDFHEISEAAIDLINVKAIVSGSISIWNDIKRHRTTLQKAESIYRAADRAYDELNSLKKGEKPKWIHVPPLAGKEFLDAVTVALEGFEKYAERYGMENAVYLVPHAVKVKMSIDMNGYHLFHPFGLLGVRLCSTVDYELQGIANQIAREIGKKVPEARDKMGPKCKTGVCPEREPCKILDRYTKA